MRDLRDLPTPVLERLAVGGHEQDMRDAGLFVDRSVGTIEARTGPIEARVADDGTVALHGYATVYDYSYRVGGEYGWDEIFAPGSCEKSASEHKDDVRFLFNHDGIPMARSQSNSMVLESDATGLLVDVPSLDVRDSSYVQSIVSALRRRDLDQMSLAFRVLRQKWEDDYTRRTILEVQLADVSIVTYPANPATVVGLRSGHPTPSGPPRTSVALARAIADLSRARG